MFSSIVLAGGKSQRLGRNKLLEEVGGKALIARVIDSLATLGGDIIIVTGAASDLPVVFTHNRVKTVADSLPDSGVLGGIYTGLTASDSLYNLVVAADMPFLNPSLLRYLLDSADGFDAVVPRLEGFIEPLHAVYTRGCLPYIKEEIERGGRDIRGFFSGIKVRYVEGEEIDRLDPRRLSLFNINNEEDLKNAREVVKKSDTL